MIRGTRIDLWRNEVPRLTSIKALKIMNPARYIVAKIIAGFLSTMFLRDLAMRDINMI